MARLLGRSPSMVSREMNRRKLFRMTPRKEVPSRNYKGIQ
jgi:IS30 family transposase